METKKDSVSGKKRRRLKQVFWLTQIALIFTFLHRTLTLGFTANEAVILFTMISLVGIYAFGKYYSVVHGIGLFLFTLTLFFCFMIWKNDGTRDEVIFGFPAIICFAAMLEQKKLFGGLFLLISFNLLAVGIANDLNWIHHGNSGSSLTSSIVLVTIFIVITYAISVVVNEWLKVNRKLTEHKTNLEATVLQRTQALEKSLLQLKEAQQQLVQNEKMASMGRLVAGVAHELNTPVGISITANSVVQDDLITLQRDFSQQQLTKSQLESVIDKTIESNKIALSNLHRASALITEFKQAAVENNPHPIDTFNLSQLIDNVIESLHSKTRLLSVDIVRQYPTDLPMMSSPSALSQILESLFINSLIHAFKDNDSPRIEVSAKIDEQDVVITYSDNGIGMPDNVKEQVFEPFYTTKRSEGNTGLGLHIVYNLMTYGLHGSIEIDSEFSHGVRFELRLPTHLTQVVS